MSIVLDHELFLTAFLDVNLGNELVTPVAADLKAHNVPFVIASAYDRPEGFGGQILSGATNVGKPTRDARLLAALSQLTSGSLK